MVRRLLIGIAVLFSITVFFMPPPAGVAPSAMHAAALVILAVSLWVSAALPEHITGILFMLGAVLAAVAPAPVVFSGFSSGTLWLVFGGLFMAEGVRATGLGERLGRPLLNRFSGSYASILVGVVLVSLAVAFVMPATIARILLMLPMLNAVAKRMGFDPGTPGHTGILLTSMTAHYQIGICILPANAPNLVLAGVAETLYQVPIIYGEWFWVHFPVMGLLKAVVIVITALLMFPARPDAKADTEVLGPMSAAEKRMAAILITALLLWATDFLHGIRPGWVALGAGMACLLPRIGVMPMTAFNERIKYAPFFYIGAVLGMGAVMVESGLSKAIGDGLLATLDLRQGEDARNFAILVAMSTVTGVIATNPGQPAVLGPLFGEIAQATGWPIKTALLTMAVGFTTMILPHQVPPLVVGLHLAGIGMRAALRLSVPIAVFSVLVLVPLDYLWWRAIGLFG